MEIYGLTQFVLISCRVATPDYVSLEIKTEAPDGLILWQGRVRGSYVMIYVPTDYKLFSFILIDTSSSFFRQFLTKLALNFKPSIQSDLFS